MGTFQHFNGLGAYLTIALPIAYCYWRSLRSFNSLILFCVITLGLVTTYSRGALIGGIIGIYYVYTLTSKKKLTVILSMFLGTVVLLFLWNEIVTYYSHTQNYTIREYTWLIALKEALSQPIKLLYGFGPFYFREKLLGMYGTMTNLHSGQLQIILELGIIGFLILLSLFKDALKNASKYKTNPSIVSITGGLIAFFIQQLFDNSFFGNTGILWFSLLAIVFTIKENNIFKE
jgi:hypothetical protein